MPIPGIADLDRRWRRRHYDYGSVGFGVTRELAIRLSSILPIAALALSLGPLSLGALSLGLSACAVAQAPVPPQTGDRSVQALPFKGRLIDGDPGDLPADVAASLTADSPITFTYREELSHQEHRVPLIISALDPATYAGAALGEHSVTAFASLSILDGDRVLGDYTAKASVSESYDLYSEPSHIGLERAARAEVRARIDEQLSRDYGRLARETGADPAPSNPILSP
jgi:hypothetical protein